MSSITHLDSTQQNQELESRNDNDQRTEVETEEQPPEQKLDVSTITEFEIMDADVRDFEMLKTLNFPLVNWKVEEIVYNQELQEYLTIHEFTRKIKKFNATSRKLRMNRMIVFFPWIILSLLFIICIITIRDKGQNASLERIICGILLSKIIIGVFAYYLFIWRKGKQQKRYLNDLLKEFNKKDLSKNVNWKLVTSDKHDDKMCLAIELGLPPMYQEHPSLREVSRVITIHDDNPNPECPSIVNVRESVKSVDFRESVKSVNVRESVKSVNVRESVKSVNVRESVKSVNSIDIDNYQIRTAIKTRYFYEAIPNIPPPTYYRSIGKDRCTSNNAIYNGKIGVDDNATNETLTSNGGDDYSTSIHSFRSEYYETRSSL